MNGGGSTPVREARAPVAQMLLIGAIASALGITLALLINWTVPTTTRASRSPGAPSLASGASGQRREKRSHA